MSLTHGGQQPVEKAARREREAGPAFEQAALHRLGSVDGRHGGTTRGTLVCRMRDVGEPKEIFP